MRNISTSTRWTVAAGTILFAATAGFASASQPAQVFDVFLNSRLVGSHSFEVAANGNGATIQSRASFVVRVLGVPIYRYEHQADEQWNNDCLVRMDGQTRDNGKQLVVAGQKSATGFDLTSPRKQSFRNECVVSYAYWDIDRLLGATALLNPQTGVMDPVRMQSLGEQAFALGGTTLPARRYRLAGDKSAIDLWYSRDGQWLGLDSELEKGRILSYRLRSPQR